MEAYVRIPLLTPCCLFVPLIYGCYSSRTYRSWWTANSAQRQRRGCNNPRVLHRSRHWTTPMYLQRSHISLAIPSKAPHASCILPLVGTTVNVRLIVAYGGYCYWVWHVTMWCHIHIFKPMIWRSLLTQYECYSTHRCRNRQFLVAQRIFCGNLPEKRVCDILSLDRLSAAVGAFYFTLPCCHRKIENLVLEVWFLITQLKKVYVRLCKNIVRSQLAQYSEHLLHKSEVWRSIYNPAVAVSKEPQT